MQLVFEIREPKDKKFCIIVLILSTICKTLDIIIIIGKQIGNTPTTALCNNL